MGNSWARRRREYSDKSFASKLFSSLQLVFSVAPAAATLMLLQVFVSSAADPFSLFCMQELIESLTDSDITHDKPDMLLWISLLVISALLSDNISCFKSLQIISIQSRLNSKLTNEIVKKFGRITYQCFEDPAVMDSINRMGSQPQQRILKLFQGCVDILSNIVITIGLAAVVAQVSISLSLILIAVIVFMLRFEYQSVKLQVELDDRQAQEERELDYLESLMGDKRSILEFHIFQAAIYIKMIWENKARTVLANRIKTAIRSQKYRALSSLCFLTWIVVLILVSSQNLLSHSITLGNFIAVIGTIKSLSTLNYVMDTAFSNITRNQLEMSHYHTFIGLPETKKKVLSDSDKEIMQTINSGAPLSIRFRNVSFRYPNSEDFALQDVSFEISSASLTALVGPNGAGKTTIVKLLARLYEPVSGCITINGIPIQQLSQSCFQFALSFAFQDHVNYRLSLRENVGLGSIEKLNEDFALISALRRSRFCSNNESPNLDKQLGRFTADGTDLSGGQWQRLSIARAVLPDSKIIVLDEPTASLDPIAENCLYEAIASSTTGRGALIISHRMATALMCQRIIVLNHGSIVETGTHLELMQKGGLYRKMYEAQASWYFDDQANEID